MNLIPATIFGFIPTNREIIMIFEAGLNENLEQTLSGNKNKAAGMGAFTNDFLIAFYQKPSPFLVTGPFLDNIVAHKRLFEEFVKGDTKTLHKKYGHYDRFKAMQDIEEFQRHCRFYDDAFKKIEIPLKAGAIKTNNSALFNEIQKPADFDSFNSYMGKFMACVRAPFEDYTITQITNAKKPEHKVYLMVPKWYEKKFKNEGIGLKAGKRIDINALVLGKEAHDYLWMLDCEENFVEQLPNVFETKKDINDTEYPYVWGIILGGHGSFAQENAIKVQKMRDERVLYEKQIDEAKNTKNNDAFNQAKAMIKKINKEINYISDMSYIAGMNIRQFRKIVQFFNNSIVTSILCYASCSSGGQNMIDAFKESSTGLPLAINYTLVSLALTEAYTLGTVNGLRLRFGYNGKLLLTGTVDESTQSFKIETPLDYNKYFEELRKPSGVGKVPATSYVTLFSYVAEFPHEGKKMSSDYIANIPSMRVPNSDWSSIINVGKAAFDLTKVKTIAQGNKPLALKDYASILIAPEEIPFDITIGLTANDFPAIISKQAGKGKHIFESLTTPYSIKEIIVNGFFALGGNLQSSKLFLIKKLKAKSDEYKDAVIFNNALIPLSEGQSGIIATNVKTGKVEGYVWSSDTTIKGSRFVMSEGKDYEQKRQAVLKFFDVSSTKITASTIAEKITAILPKVPTETPKTPTKTPKVDKTKVTTTLPQVVKPAGNPIVKPAVKPVLQPVKVTQVVKPVANPAVQPAVISDVQPAKKPIKKPAVVLQPVTLVTKPKAKPIADLQPVKPTTRPVVKPALPTAKQSNNIFDAVTNNDTAALNKFIKQGWVNQQDNEKRTALWFAVTQNNIDMVKILLLAKANPLLDNSASWFGKNWGSPLEKAQNSSNPQIKALVIAAAKNFKK